MCYDDEETTSCIPPLYVNELAPTMNISSSCTDDLIQSEALNTVAIALNFSNEM